MRAASFASGVMCALSNLESVDEEEETISEGAEGRVQLPRNGLLPKYYACVSGDISHNSNNSSKSNNLNSSNVLNEPRWWVYRFRVSLLGAYAPRATSARVDSSIYPFRTL